MDGGDGVLQVRGYTWVSGISHILELKCLFPRTCGAQLQLMLMFGYRVVLFMPNVSFSACVYSRANVSLEMCYKERRWVLRSVGEGVILGSEGITYM